MRTPTIHLNGTGKDALLDQATDACDALESALEAMSAAAPNGRDYYPQGPAAIGEAMREQEGRIAAVRSVLSQYRALAEAIADASE